MDYVVILVSAIFVNNIVLAQFLRNLSLLGVSKKVPTALGMSGAVLFVVTLATIVTYTLRKSVLVPFEIEFLQTVVFILVIASLVQMVEIALKKVAPPLYESLGVYLPLITTNCAILGVSILTIQNEYTLLEGVVFAIANAIGFGLAMVLFAGLREHMNLMKLPKQMEGTPIALVTAGLLSLAFMGFAGIV